MIEKDKEEGKWIVHCDGCSYYEEYDFSEVDDFYELIEIIKKYWKITKKLGEWIHLCQDCRDKKGKNEKEDIYK